MPTFVTSGTDAPTGVPIMSASGRLAAVVHTGFPGVLLGVFDAGADSLGIERLDLADPSREWVTVRTAGPMWLSMGSGVAYDLEAEYGRTYVYRPAYWGEPDPRHSVVVRMPDYTSCGAYLKHLRRPDLSRPVRIMEGWEPSEPTSMTAPRGFGQPAAAVDARAGIGHVAGTLTLRTYDELSWRALSALLTEPGVLLLQCSPDHGIDPMWLVRGDIGHARPRRDGFHVRDFVVPVVQVPRPLDLDTPPVIPGWTWAAATADLTLADVDRTYPSEWQMLLAGVQGWAGAGAS